MSLEQTTERDEPDGYDGEPWPPQSNPNHWMV